jgi:hypothetical protein
MTINKQVISALLFGALCFGATYSVIADDQWADGHVDEHEHHHGKDGHADEHEHHHGKDGHADEHEHHHASGSKNEPHEHHHKDAK